MIVRELLFRLGLRVNPREFQKAERGVERLRGTATSAAAGVSSLAGSIGGMLAALGGAAALFAGGRWLVGTISSMETLKTSLITVTGSAEAAEAAFAMIREFAAKTPFQVEEVATAFRKLSAMGLDPSMAALEAYGNTAAAMGKSLDQMIEAVADAATGEFERLKEFGIKASSQGNKVTFTFRGVKTTVKKEAAEIEKYLQGIGMTQFAGGMERQSKTLSGLWSTLKDQLAAFAMAVGESGLLDAMHEFLGVLFEAAGGGGVLAKALGFVLGNSLKFISTVLKAVINLVKQGVELFRRLVPPDLLERSGEFAEKLKQVAKFALLAASPIALLFLLMEDFVAFMQGRKSVIGDFVDQLRDSPGIVGDLARGLERLKDPAFWDEVKARAVGVFEAIKGGVKTGQSVLTKLAAAWDKVVRVFGTFKRLFDLWWGAARPVLETYQRIAGRIADAWVAVGEKTAQLSGPLGRLGEALGRVADLALRVWESFVQTEAVQSFAEWFGDVINDVLKTFELLQGVASTVFLAVYDKWVEHVGAMIDLAAKLIDGLVTGIDKLPAALMMAWVEFFSWLEGTINAAVGAINSMIADVEKVSGLVGVDLGRIGEVSLGAPGVPGIAPATAGSGQTNVNSTVGSVTVQIDGTTDMGEQEIRRAVRDGMFDMDTQRWQEVERLVGAGPR